MNEPLAFKLISFAVVALTSYLLLRRSRFDIYTAAYVGSALYYVPMIYHGPEFYYQTNLIYWLVLISIAVSGYVYDALTPPNYAGAAGAISSSRKEMVACILRITALASLLLLLFLLGSYGLRDFFVPKQEQLRAGYVSTAYAVLIVIGVVLGISVNNKGVNFYFL